MHDKDLRPEDIQSLSNADGIVDFFADLGYDTSARIAQSPANLGITNESLVKETIKIELVASQEGLLQVYLFELSSVTVANTQAITRAFRNRIGNYLLVLTSDYSRIDFVLVERLLPEEKDEGIGSKQPSIKPRILTIDRLKPTRVDLRVLRRFSYTESDPYEQYEKLRAAYVVADWSEEFFNNRALFSDYYLLERLRTEDDWKENIKPSYSRFRELYQDARSSWSGKPEREFRKGFLEHVFGILDFEFKESKLADDDGRNPDYIFWGDKKHDKLLCLCLTYSWGRSLDGKDYTRDKDTPEENPGAVVVSLLDRGETDWVIVTNGKHWRLYSSKAHSRATNYYEIDLEEVMARLDPEESFRYFYLFFRKEAFLAPDGATFLDKLLKGSEEYAKKLGERLKKRVFEEIFPHFAEGFISHIRKSRGVQELSQDELNGVFHGTLTFLYRLLFTLYAEARNLLPVRELRGYREISLKVLKEDISCKLGDLLFEDKDGSKEIPFDSEKTSLYDRLQKLFGAIDSGDSSINVPAYNGGLFMMNVNPDDETPEAENARFLLANRIPDRYLAAGLDLLARDEDDKTFKQVFIDYKSLGVRQLGSIYEGLLEFHLRIAPEKMAICEGKKTEEIITYREAIKQKRKILKTGRGRNAVERVLQKDAVYLENTKHERKATGSYYTPDYIVKYIVENTVGPVLKEKFDALTPKFREAQRAYREAVKRKAAFQKLGQKGDNPEKVAFTYRDLVDELFDVKVLDPAMGSGHFLVEAVDLTTDKMIDFLNGFPWNPVISSLRETKETILKAMDEKSIAIDETRLTDLNLLKRHVLKRCIYGVDLNPMAVELAKVSLWLDCFTLGAPLSFLDHHLKCGNSLIGATEKEFEEAQRGQLSLLARSQATGAKQAVPQMIQVGALPDITFSQARESKRQYNSASATLAPIKRLFDVYISQWFGNDVIKAGKGKREEHNPALEFLRDGVSEEWAFHPDKAKLSKQFGEVAGVALNASRQKKFFHWELEFPEVFYGLRPGTTQIVERKKDGGFDAVIGNPPYDVLASEELGFDVSQDLEFYENSPAFESAIRGKKNLYKLFICRGAELMGQSGAFSYIVPMALLGDDQSSGVRRHLLEKTDLSLIESFPQKDDPENRVFKEAKLSTTLFVTRSNPSGNCFTLRTHPGRWIESSSPILKLAPKEVLAFDPENSAIPSCTQKDWELVVHIITHEKMQRMGEVAKSFQGEVNETNERAREVLHDTSVGPLALRGASICLYAAREASQGENVYIDVAKFISGKDGDSKAFAYRQKRIGFQRSAPQNNFRRIIAAPLDRDSFCLDTVSYVTEDSCQIDLDLFLALLNSKILDWYFRLASTNSKVNEYQFNALPVPMFSEESTEIKWKELFEKKLWNDLAELLCSICSEPGVMPKPVAEVLAEMSRAIQQIEAKRVLANRSERSRLAPESQPIQDAVDKVLFRCYGLSDEDEEYICRRLEDML